MATVAQCEKALEELAAQIARAGGTGDQWLERSVSCRITDLDVTFAGRLREGTLHDIVRAESDVAEIRLAVTGDDLVALVDGSLGFGAGWSTGRLSVKASMLDLLKLRKML